MAQNAHTPGPWEKVIHGEDYPGSYIAIYSTGNHWIAEAKGNGGMKNTKIGPADNSQIAANAALIAAAPDMLEALQQIAEGAGRYSKDPLTHAENCIEDMQAIARAAIAKATNYKEKCDKCNGNGEVEKTVYRGDEGMEIEMDVMVECSECDGSGKA